MAACKSRKGTSFTLFSVLPIIFVILIFTFLLPEGARAEPNFIDARVREQVLKINEGTPGAVMGAITELGDGRSNLAIAGLLPDEEARKDALQAFGLSGISVNLLKVIAGRERPPGDGKFQLFSSDLSRRAFPSGHTMTSFALAAVIAKHYPEYRWLAYGTATLIGISRLFEDAHWATDVIAGAALGYGSGKMITLEIISW